MLLIENKNANLVHINMLQCILQVYFLSFCLSYGSIIAPNQEFPASMSIEDPTYWISNPVDVCQTPACIQTANDIMENMELEIHPCDDFYKFACGGYIAKHSIPDDKSAIGVFSDVRDELNRQLKELLDRELDESQPKFVDMLKNHYYSCMNLESIEDSNSEPLKKILNSLGGWPVVQGESWDVSNFDWMEAVLKFRKLGYNFNILVNVGVVADLKNNIVNIIKIDETDLGMPDRIYLINGLNDSATAAYFDLMVKAANKLGANGISSKKELMNAIEFEMALARYTLPNEQKRNFTALYNKYTVRELKELAPNVDWFKYLDGLVDNHLSELDTVVVSSLEFLKKFSELIRKTDKRTIANYMMWRIVLGSFPMLSKEWRDLAQEYAAKITGSSKEEPRWKQCIGSLSYNLEIALSSYYVRNYFKAESKVKADEMVNYLRKEFLLKIENLDWMDESTRTQAKEKANTMISFIGYPQDLVNDSLVLKYYQNLTITIDSYFNNVLRLRKWKTDYYFSKLRKTNIKGDWITHGKVAIVNAFYHFLENSIDIPAGILQKAFFSKDRPHYMNFGAIGVVIGHEITHGFDDKGRQFDKDGNNRNWWDEVTDKHFREKAKCIIYQYGNYTAENGMKLNGVNTQGENIADNGGIKEAYLAYQAWVDDNGPEPKLPGLDYTPHQLFWISAANIWCAKQRPEDLKNYIISNVHSPAPFRVIGPMSNSPDFAKDFQCPTGSSMNPKHKCRVW